MENYIHIILENGAQAPVIKSHIEDNRKGLKGRIKEFVDDLSIGPIVNYENEQQSREEWFKEILQIRVPDYDFTIEEAYANLSRTLETIDLAAKVVIWHGKSAKEYINLCYLVTYFKDYEVYEADITQHVKLEEEEKVYYMTRLMQCSKDQLRETLDSLSAMTDVRKQELMEQWELYKKLTGDIRVLKNGQVAGEAITYYDELLLAQLEKNVEKQVREIVGAVRITIEETMGDWPSKLLLEYRIKVLVQEGQLEVVQNHPAVEQVVVKKVER